MKEQQHWRNFLAEQAIVSKHVMNTIVKMLVIRLSNNVSKRAMATLEEAPCCAKLGKYARKYVLMDTAYFLVIKAENAFRNVAANTAPRLATMGTAPANNIVSLETAR